MQVDAIYFSNANISNKRLRSSVSPSPSERPSKRMSMGPESNVATPSFANSSLPEDFTMNEGSISTETRGRLEDWVTKTGGLKLDSPSTSGFGQLLYTTPLPEGREWTPSVTDTTIITPLPDLRLLNDSLISKAIRTSTEELVDAHMHNTEPSLSTSSDSNEDTSLLWLSSTITTPLPQTPRKSKIKMGRRADCEKCRLGVKGHWMHID
ncbi:hypothetical protein Clacol_006257 [Clathrus columnatus]|uniref:Uncharacterized protein n=1 Tax=Clathrus columnatus TaxID=1419009 RepID=A0AAV5AFQ6_9AGAM|nr:hypothetical protein Clacol_006257 [Clathrus columnatus]